MLWSEYVCPSKIHGLTLKVMVLGGRAIRICLGNEDWALVNRINALVKVTHSVPLFILPCEDSENTLYEPGSRFLPDTKSAGGLFLNFSDSENLRNKSLLLINHPVCVILLQQPKQTKTPTYLPSLVLFFSLCMSKFP